MLKKILMINYKLYNHMIFEVCIKYNTKNEII